MQCLVILETSSGTSLHDSLFYLLAGSNLSFLAPTSPLYLFLQHLPPVPAPLPPAAPSAAFSPPSAAEYGRG